MTKISQKRVNVIAPLEMLVEALGAEVVQQGMKGGQIIAHNPGEVGAIQGALGQYGGYMLAFAAGVIATAVASGTGIQFGLDDKPAPVSTVTGKNQPTQPAPASQS